MPSERLCVVIGRTRHKMIQIEMKEAARRGARLIEIRLDFLAKSPDFKRLLADKPCPLVATVRRPSDGGRWNGTAEARLMLLRQAVVAGFDWVDLETDIADSVRRFGKVKRIVSYHNMQEVPADLEDLHARMCKQDADVVKIAVFAQAPEDNLRVLNLIRASPKPTVALCMGDLGAPSRILASKFGAPFTYAAFNKERLIAPGIPAFEELRTVYHYDRINADTAVYGLIGDPVAHSLSPLIHNDALRQLGLNGVYLPFRVPRGLLPTFLRAFAALPVDGYSVTIPHKEAAVEVATRRDPLVAATGAANTLVRGPDGFTAYNTDCEAAMESLKAHLASVGPAAPDIQKAEVLLLGAGGAARAVAHGLDRLGAKITIANRNQDRADKLAEEIDARTVPWTARHTVDSDILINATSIGMHPNVDDSPVQAEYLREGMVVFDTVYNPENTLLIKTARAARCSVLTGVDMFVRQAAMQFRLFTGREASVELMRTLVRRALSPVKEVPLSPPPAAADTTADGGDQE